MRTKPAETRTNGLSMGLRLVAVSALIAGLAGCNQRPSKSSSGPPQGRPLRLAVTTSTRDSGLLDRLLPMFESQNSVAVQVLAVGTGAALKLGEAGDVDAVLVHARDAEDAFMTAGHGVRREDVMYNRFQILGPNADPAAIRGLDVLEALRRIAASNSVFVSRGDDSGTDRREKQLWQAAEAFPNESSYLETGQGMGPTLMIASDKQAYVLSDSGTAINLSEKTELLPLVDSGKLLENHYGVIAVAPEKSTRIQSDMADAFIDFLISSEGQRAIAAYRVRGKQLFFPAIRDVPSNPQVPQRTSNAETND